MRAHIYADGIKPLFPQLEGNADYARNGFWAGFDCRFN